MAYLLQLFVIIIKNLFGYDHDLIIKTVEVIPMNRLIFCLIIMMITLYIPATSVQACSMHDESDGHMAQHDAYVHNNTEHMDHQGDMVIQHPDNSAEVPESDVAQPQPTAEPESVDQQPTTNGEIKRREGTKPILHTHSTP